jgi:hypothetical protein
VHLRQQLPELREEAGREAVGSAARAEAVIEPDGAEA